MAIEEDLDQRRGRDDRRDRPRGRRRHRATSPPARRASSPGLRVAEAVLSVRLHATSSRSSGTWRTATAVEAGQKLLTVATRTRDLLTAERSALNLLCRLSGIATATRAWADVLEGTKARVRDTRKTTPGLRALEKYAVRCGGGVNHRMSLSDAALVKDNHVVAAGGVAAGVQARYGRSSRTCRSRSRSTPCDQLARGARRGRRPDPAGQLHPGETARGRGDSSRGRAVLEASGRLTLDNARAYAETGVDYLAVGALTHSSPILDIGLDLRAAA